MELILENATTVSDGDAFPWRGGIGNFVGVGNFGTGTVRLEMSPDGGTTWLPVGADTTLTEPGIGNFHLNPCDLRASVTVIGGGTDVSAYLGRQ